MNEHILTAGMCFCAARGGERKARIQTVHLNTFSNADVIEFTVLF